MQLTGWQRLWVVATALWTAPVAWLAYETAPNAEDFRSRWASQLPDAPRPAIEALERCRQQGKRAAADDPSLNPYLLFIECSKADTAYGISFRKLEQEYRDKAEKEITEKLPRDLAAHYFTHLAVWLVPALLVYLLGMSIAWVVRGFRTPSGSAAGSAQSDAKQSTRSD